MVISSLREVLHLLWEIRFLLFCNFAQSRFTRGYKFIIDGLRDSIDSSQYRLKI